MLLEPFLLFLNAIKEKIQKSLGKVRGTTRSGTVVEGEGPKNCGLKGRAAVHRAKGSICAGDIEWV